MAGRTWLYRVGAALVGVVAAAVIGVVVFLCLTTTLIGPTREKSVFMHDQNSLRQLAGLAALESELPLRDGAFDPYAFVRSGVIAGKNLKLLRSERSGKGPTDEEIERGDYANFPWERYRGEGRREGPPFPILWEREPDRDGGRLVALSDGSSRYMEEAEFEIALRRR